MEICAHLFQKDLTFLLMHNYAFKYPSDEPASYWGQPIQVSIIFMFSSVPTGLLSSLSTHGPGMVFPKF